VSHGRPAFFTKKVFAYYGGSLKVDGERAEHPRAITVQPDESDRQALLEDERTFGLQLICEHGRQRRQSTSDTRPERSRSIRFG